MTTSSEVFISTDLVGMDKGLHTISIFENWQASYDNEPLGLTPSAALCLSALLSLRDRLTTTVDRDEAILQIHNEANARGMQATEFYVRDSLQHHDRIRRSSESLLLRKTSRLYPYLYSLGNIGAKRILFCSNVQVIDGGMKAIETLYPDDENLEQREQLFKEFLKEYRHRETNHEIGRTTKQTSERLSEQTLEIPDTKEAVKKEKPKKVKYVHESSVQEQKDYVAEVRSGYTPFKEYAEVALDYMYGIQIGENTSEGELLELLKDAGYNPFKSDVDVMILEFCKKGIFKKTKLNGTEKIVYVRFN
jgi:hypothetical protein